MKKNTVLYVLLIILIVMNGFFLFNYLGQPEHRGPKESSDFIARELNFNDAQIQQFQALEEEHHEAIRALGNDTRALKDELFDQITATTTNQSAIDSLMTLISEDEKLREKEMFNRLRGIYELCNDKQKEEFSNILKKAKKFDHPGPEGPEGPNGPPK